MLINFIIPEKPQPQERPYFHHAYIAMDRPKSRKAKKLVKQYAALAIQAKGNPGFGPEYCGRVSIRLGFFGARQNADLDNLYKLITDACQGVVYRNDCQIDYAEICRNPCEKGSERTEVVIESL